MPSIFLVLALSFAIAVQGFDFTVTEANGTSTESRPSPSNVITDKQINNAHFSRRTVDVKNETEKPVEHKARHTMIADSEIKDSNIQLRGIPEDTASEPSVDRKARRTTIIDSQFHNNDFILPRVTKRNASEPSVDRTARHTMIVDGTILNSRFRLRGIDKDSNSEMPRDRRDTVIIGGTGSGNRFVELPRRSYNEFIVDGDSVSASHFSNGNGNSVNVMRVGPSSNGMPNAQYAQAAADVQSMPMGSNGGPQFSVSASAPATGLPGVLQGAVINGATFSRRTVDGSGEEKMPVERKSRNTFINKSQINDGRFSRRSAHGLGETKMPVERKSRNTFIDKSQINDGVFTRRDVNIIREDVLLA